MKFLLVCLFTGLLMFAGSAVYAQENSTVIQGKVSTENGTSADMATVILLAADSAILKSTICDNTGAFKFAAIEPGTYLVLASKIGFNQSLKGPFKIMPNGIINTDIRLTLSVPQLKEVTISSQRPYVEVKPGKVILNVQGSPIAEGNSAYDILRQAPGVKAGRDGNISIIGRQSALITIDGKPTNMKGEDLSGYLEGMSSSAIQQIELITNPSAKYDAAGAGIINIISKKGTNIGTNGTITAGGGYGSFYKSNGSIVLNNRSDKFNFFGNYTLTADKIFHNFTADRMINYNGAASEYDVDYYATQKKYNNVFRAGIDYYISPQQTLGVLFYGSVSKNDFVKTNNLKIANNGVLDSTISTNSKLSRDINNLNYDINYNGVLDKAGKTLMADVLFNEFTRQSREFIVDNFYNAAGNVYRQPLYLQNLSPSTIHNWVAKIDYANPMSKTSKMEAGVKYSSIKSNNDLIFGPYANGQYQSDPKFSNTFLYNENVNSAYLNYTNNLEKLDIVAGLRAEQTNTSGNSVTLMQVSKKSYLDFLPQIQLTYKPDEKNNLTLSYNRGLTRPQYTDINPFLYYVDVYDYRSGNPNLLPQYSNKIELEHSYNKLFTTSLYAQVTTGFYDFNEYLQNDATKVAITTINNFGNYYIYGLRFYTPVQFANWWNASFHVDASYQRIKAYTVNGNLDKGTPDIQFSSIQTFKISSTTTLNIPVKYESPTFYGISLYKAAYYVDADITQQLFNKKASLKLSVFDIFNTKRDRLHSNYQNLNLEIMDKTESRMVRLNFTYHFGKTSVKTAKHEAANADEQNRAVGPVSN